MHHPKFSVAHFPTIALALILMPHQMCGVLEHETLSIVYVDYSLHSHEREARTP